MGPSALQYLELKTLATNLSIQNRNLQEIALKQKGMLSDKEE